MKLQSFSLWHSFSGSNQLLLEVTCGALFRGDDKHPSALMVKTGRLIRPRQDTSPSTVSPKLQLPARKCGSYRRPPLQCPRSVLESRANLGCSLSSCQGAQRGPTASFSCGTKWGECPFWLNVFGRGCGASPGTGWRGAVAAMHVCGTAGGSLRWRVHTSSVTRAACSRGTSPELSIH